MIPLHLRLSGFLSYREPVDIDFTTFELACISGSNGAGKSSLLDAITWALYGKARKQDDSLIHNLAKSAEVSLIFTYEENVYRIQRTKIRDKTGMLEFQILQPDGDTAVPNGKLKDILSGSWKTLTEHSMTETTARIQETLRLDYETFVNASFFLQGKADQFTQQRPGDRKRILSNILGLEIWGEYQKKALALRRGVED
ncbi:MAG: SMC family ATPase, partial [Anaerolineales bacterium]|nr:SMC family ATPase [Anaerolineales bacterium]